MITRRGVLGLLALPLPGQAVVELGDRRELFVDRRLVGELRGGAQLRLGQVVDGGTAIAFDQKWEGPFTNYATVIAHGGRYRLYYRGVATAGADGRDAEVTCVAESGDGVRFERPAVGLHNERGRNVVLAGEAPLQHNFSPLVDRTGTYKALAGTKKSGLVAFHSEDGLRWRKLQAAPVLTEGDFDSQNVAFWSAAEGQYVCYFRTFKNVGGTRYRWVSRAVSEDFVRWRVEGEVDFGGAPVEHLYTNQLHPYYRAPQVYVGLCARFFPGKQVLTEEEARGVGVQAGYYRDCSDAVLVSSRGGRRVDRTYLEAVLRPGPGLKNWVSRSNYPALNIVPAGEGRMAFYVVRDYGQASIHLQRYVMREDGLASVGAGYGGGSVVTPWFRYRGRRLELNFATSAAGMVKVSLEDERGQVVAESREMVGDFVSREVPWGDVGEWAGKVVRLRVQMKDADVYALRFGS